MKIAEVLLEMYTAYVLDESSRQRLSERFPPKYSNFIGHHVTVNFGVDSTAEIPSPAEINVIGHVDSENGIEALVVSVDRKKRRDDGSLFHITWSIDPSSDYKPKDSNDLVRTRQYTIVRQIPISTEPTLLK